VVHCEVVEGVVIDEMELASMEEMMREANSEPTAAQIPILNNARTSDSRISDVNLMTRSSMMAM